MRTRMAVLATVVAMLAAMLALGGPALAHEGHAGCGAFGTGVAALAQGERPFGQNVVSPGPASGDIRGFHAAFCEPKP